MRTGGGPSLTSFFPSSPWCLKFTLVLFYCTRSRGGGGDPDEQNCKKTFSLPCRACGKIPHNKYNNNYTAERAVVYTTGINIIIYVMPSISRTRVVFEPPYHYYNDAIIIILIHYSIYIFYYYSIPANLPLSLFRYYYFYF